MKKSGYIVSSLFLCALTAFFMLFPSAVESYKNSKNARGQILEKKLVQSTHNYTAAQVIDIIAQNSDATNTTRVESSKTESEYVKNCDKILDSISANADAITADYFSAAKKQMQESKKKKFTAYKLVAIYNSELAWINFSICEFNGITICYEEQNEFPLFILLNSSTANSDFGKYLYNNKFYSILTKLLEKYYEDLDAKEYEMASDAYANINDTADGFSQFSGLDIMHYFCQNLMSNTYYERDITTRQKYSDES